jgi:N-acyl-D-aspartate/D-glutamate deacylase
VRLAPSASLVALAAAVRESPGTTLECILAGCLNGFTDDEMALLTQMSVAGNRPINWNVLGVSAGGTSNHDHQLGASDYAASRGGRVVALTLPHSVSVRLSFLTGFVFDGLPGWGAIMALPVPERMKAMADPEVRRRMKEGAASDEAGVLRGLANWSRLEIVEAFAPENLPYEGRTVSEIVSERGAVDAFDVLCEILLADELRTGLRPAGMVSTEADWKLRADVWRDPRSVVGGSDAGAHLDMMCGAIYSTALLAHGVREFGVISMEDAIHQLTDVPAQLYGLTGRGRIADRYAADLIVFDPQHVGHGTARMRADLPGGASRLYAEATGMQHVFVNGVAVAENGSIIGDTPGIQLRSGRDTYTVAP